MEKPTIRILGFRTSYHKRPGNVELVARDWVKYAPVHDINTVTEEIVAHLKPLIVEHDDPNAADRGVKTGYMASLWEQIEPHYRAWKEGTEVPANGIPLSAWAGVTADQADVFRRSGIRTVEEVRDMTEAQMGRVMLPGVRSIKRMAADFLDSRKDAETASKMTALAEQNAALKDQLDEMASMIAELRGKREDTEPAKRGPGRPRKAEVADEAA